MPCNPISPRSAAWTIASGGFSIPTERRRYTRYADGSEELYDLKNDPNELQDIAGSQGSKNIIIDLRKWLPQRNESAPKNAGRRNPAPP